MHYEIRGLAIAFNDLDRPAFNAVGKDAPLKTGGGGVAHPASQNLAPLGIALAFLIGAGLYAGYQASLPATTLVVVVATILAGYMAINIGANDVANNVGPAVGARAISLFGAVLIAAVFEFAGAVIAGGDVVKTISKGIFSPEGISSSSQFVTIMLAALCAAALWVNLATYLNAPVSTTHAVVGGVIGSGIAAAGVGLINWSVMGAIAASWVVSPLIGGMVAALFLGFIKTNIIYRSDKIASARVWIPALVAVMAAAFTAYLMIKGLKRVYSLSPEIVLVTSVAVFFLTFVLTRPIIDRQSHGLENRTSSLHVLFRVPLIVSAALLSFAHGANDVANAIGPLAGIFHSLNTGQVSASAPVPLWIMIIGAAGLCLGLLFFGAQLIKTVGEGITRINPIRAYCVALAAAITVIAASALGLPVSSTHITVGAVFGVGLFREHIMMGSAARRRYIAAKSQSGYLDVSASKEVRRPVRRKLVRRSKLFSIVAAWLVTVPSAALLSAGVYLLIEAMV